MSDIEPIEVIRDEVGRWVKRTWADGSFETYTYKYDVDTLLSNKDITKYRWHKWEEDGEFNANMTIIYSELRLGRGLRLKIVDCDEKGN